MPPETNCKLLIDFLDDYLAQRLDATARSRFEEHLSLCPPCRDYLKTYSDTSKLARQCCGERCTQPLPEDLVQAILKSLGCRKGP